jgi:hypothetical protein
MLFLQILQNYKSTSTNTIFFDSVTSNTILFKNISLLMNLIGNVVELEDFMAAQQSGIVYKEVYCNQPFCLEAYVGDSGSYVEF